jgi:hypothetical protein
MLGEPDSMRLATSVLKIVRGALFFPAAVSIVALAGCGSDEAAAKQKAQERSASIRSDEGVDAAAVKGKKGANKSAELGKSIKGRLGGASAE